MRWTGNGGYACQYHEPGDDPAGLSEIIRDDYDVIILDTLCGQPHKLYAYADTEAKRAAIEKAMGSNALQGIEGRKYTENDEETLKLLYGL